MLSLEDHGWPKRRETMIRAVLSILLAIIFEYRLLFPTFVASGLGANTFRALRIPDPTALIITEVQHAKGNKRLHVT